MTPDVDLRLLAPVLAPVAAAALVLLLDALAPPPTTSGGVGGSRLTTAVRRAVPVVAGLGLAGGLAAALLLRLRTATGPLATLCSDDPVLRLDPQAPVARTCLYEVGPSTAWLQVLALLGALVALGLLLAHRRDDAAAVSAGPDAAAGDGGPRDLPVEAVLLLAAVAGATLLAASRDLATWLVGLELATLPLVALLALRGERAGGGVLPLLVSSLASFAVAVVGAGLWVTATGSLRLDRAAALGAARDTATVPLLTLAAGCLVVGVGVKLSLVPFHVWAPVAYPRAGARVAAVLSGVSVVGGLAAASVVVQALAPVVPVLAVLLGGLAALSLVLGALVALRQGDPLRLLAWSGVTQAGWVVAPLAAGDTGTAAAYLGVYLLATLTALAVLVALGPGGRHLSAHRGLARREPLLAAALGLALLTLAGLPPGVVGLLAKVLVLRSLVAADLWWLVAPAVVAVVVGLLVYLRWLAAVLAPEAAAPAHPRPAALPTALALVLAALLLVASAAPALLLTTGT